MPCIFLADEFRLSLLTRFALVFLFGTLHDVVALGEANLAQPMKVINHYLLYHGASIAHHLFIMGHL